MKKKLCRSLTAFILSVFLIGQTLIGVANAYDYTRGFVEYYGLSSITSAKSPLRSATDNTVDVYSNVNSNNNQPRVINGNADVHNATDLRASEGTAVYPILDGYVTAKSEPSSTSNNGYVTIRHVVNGTNYYVRYFHIDPEDNLYVDKFVTQTTKIAKIDTAKSWPAHLDYGVKDASPTGKSVKLYPFYRHVTDWDRGADLE
jgi:murein DD-endopeptidase MepM/ murein hydrolase activator NlpD